jgi:hypothetical protein
MYQENSSYKGDNKVKFKFHHMNLCSDNLPRLTSFYKNLFELGAITDDEHRSNPEGDFFWVV